MSRSGHSKAGRNKKGKAAWAADVEPVGMGHHIGPRRGESDNEDSNYDNNSVVSFSSSTNKWELISETDGNPLQETDNQADDGFYDDFEEKLLEAIDATSEKSSKTRQAALEHVKKAMVSRFLFDFVVERRITMSDLLDRCIRKGKGEEQGSAALLASIVCVTLGSSDETDCIFKDIQSHLRVTLCDGTASPSTRSKCAQALGLCCFIAGSGSESISGIMSSLYSVFSASFFKGNGAIPSHAPNVTALHSCALSSWTLLLTIQSSSYISNLMSENVVTKLIQLLESADVDLRITAGEAIAVLNEINCAYEADDNFCDDIDGLCAKLRQLATDSQKFRAKKDRRIQRSSFRDVLKAVEENDVVSIVIKFGKERVLIDSWCKKHQYDAFCHVLGSGMNLHLTENQLLRDIFELGPPVKELGRTVNPSSKVTKFERHMGNIATCKARTKTRSKLRDKRTDAWNN